MSKTTNKYTINEAIQKLKTAKKTKFDQTVELHINLFFDNKKQDQQIRFTTILPHGTGKTKKVAVFASKKVNNADLELKETDIAKIEKSEIRPGKDFDVLVSEPSLMPKLAKVAKILGPAGVMPNPKTGTVAEDVEKAVEQIKKGKIEIKLEQTAPIIHTIIGKLSFDTTKLVENFQEIVNGIKQNKPSKAGPDFIKSIFICATMGKSYQVDIQ